MKGNWNFSGNMRNFKISVCVVIGKEFVLVDFKMFFRFNFKVDVFIEILFKGLKKVGVVFFY